MTAAVLEAAAGTTIHASTGQFARNQPDRLSTERFYRAEKGCRIRLLRQEYLFNVATYAFTVNDALIYDYQYSDSGFAVTYNHDLSGGSYRQDDYIFAQQCLYRICIKRADGSGFTAAEAEQINDILYAEAVPLEGTFTPNPVFDGEIQKTIAEINRSTSASTCKLCLVTDSHISVCGTWPHTADHIRQVHEAVGFDAIVHLGDLTDGMASKQIVAEQAKGIINDLKQNGVPVCLAIGNHDSNYFKGNPEPFSIAEQCRVYLSHLESAVRPPDCPWYYRDFEAQRLRCFFLHSFDPRQKNRYGFPQKEIDWLQTALEATPEDRRVLVFSHIPPHTKLDYWSTRIRGQEAMIRTLKQFHQKNGRLLGFIHGHTHADSVYEGYGFPVISVGCSKLEYFTDKKPEGSVTPPRRIHTVSQELWDTLLIDTETGHLRLVRFGAGENRTIYAGG